ncbi:unnamed protein product [Leptidea sinapis]|nr:unnamed protein product [Leptidea sinapis]
MVTGDSGPTALAVAQMVGLDVLHSQALSGEQLDTMTDEQLDGVIDTVSVFYRVTPKHKLSIVKSLQRLGNIVGMTASRHWHRNGKERDRQEGKCIFYNIRNFVRFQLSTSIAALSLITLATLMGIPNPLNAMQILSPRAVPRGGAGRPRGGAAETSRHVPPHHLSLAAAVRAALCSHHHRRHSVECS